MAAILLFTLFPVAMVGLLLCAWINLSTPVMLIMGALGSVGTLLGIWTSTGAFRRSRNSIAIFLCREHLGRFQRLARRRRWAKAGAILVIVVVALFGIQAMAFTWFAPLPIALPIQLAVFVGPPALLIAAVAGYRFTKKRLVAALGVDVRLDVEERHLLLTCRNAEFARVAADRTLENRSTKGESNQPRLWTGRNR